MTRRDATRKKPVVAASSAARDADAMRTAMVAAFTEPEAWTLFRESGGNDAMTDLADDYADETGFAVESGDYGLLEDKSFETWAKIRIEADAKAAGERIAALFDDAGFATGWVTVWPEEGEDHDPREYENLGWIDEWRPSKELALGRDADGCGNGNPVLIEARLHWGSLNHQRTREFMDARNGLGPMLVKTDGAPAALVRVTRMTGEDVAAAP